MFNPRLKIGKTIKNAEVASIFKCSTAGEMRRSTKTDTLVIITDYTKGLYHDKWIGGVLHYTGTGKKGDQNIHSAQNAALCDSGHNGLDIHLFEVIKPAEYIYCGRVVLADKPYPDIEPDESGAARMVWRFPVRPVPDNDVPKPSMYVFADMEDFKANGQNVDEEFQKLRQQGGITRTTAHEAPAMNQGPLKVEIKVPEDIVGKEIVHKKFGPGQITASTETTITVTFEDSTQKTLGYDFCMSNNMIEFCDGEEQAEE